MYESVYSVCVSGCDFSCVPRSLFERASMFDFSDSFNSYFVSKNLLKSENTPIYPFFIWPVSHSKVPLSVSLIKAWYLWVVFVLKRTTRMKTMFPWVPPSLSLLSPQGQLENTPDNKTISICFIWIGCWRLFDLNVCIESWSTAEKNKSVGEQEKNMWKW